MNWRFLVGIAGGCYRRPRAVFCAARIIAEAALPSRKDM
jgi:hypothetical protein